MLPITADDMEQLAQAAEFEALRSPEQTRAEVNVAATRLAANMRRFMEEAGTFLSLARRYHLTSAAMELEAMADGR